MSSPSLIQRLKGRFSFGSEPEKNSGNPVAGMPGTQYPPTIQEMIQQYVRTAVSASAEAEGQETFEEADDFEMDDPEDAPFLPTHHQVIAMSEDELRGHAASYNIDLDDGAAAQAALGPSGGPEGANPSQPATPKPLE